MNTRPTIITFLIAALLVTAALIINDMDGISAQAQASRRPLLGVGQLPVEDVHTITLQRRDEPTLTFQRESRSWWQTEPFRHPVNIFSMRELINAARDLEFVSVIDPDGDEAQRASLAALSLDPPDAAITFAYGERSIGLELGRRGIAGRAYLRIAGQPQVYVVNQVLHDRAVEMDPKEWRDRTIFRDVTVEATRIERRNGANRMELERRQRRWRLLEPVQTRAARGSVEEYISALARVEVGGYILDQPEDVARFGLDDPVAELTITMAGASADGGSASRAVRRQTLLVGSTVGVGSQDRFGKMDGIDTVVRLRAAVLAELFRDPTTLIDPTGTGVQPADVKRIRITRPDGELVLERDLERWIAPAYDELEVPYETVENLLRIIATMPAPTVEVKPYPQDLEVAVITLFGYDGRARDTVRLAREPEDGRWALENGDNVLRVFPQSMAVPLTAEDFALEGMVAE